jgi:hypothetical protein
MTSPVPEIVIAPPLLNTGPVIDPVIACSGPVQAAWAAPDGPSAARAISDAPASSAARDRRGGECSGAITAETDVV